MKKRQHDARERKARAEEKELVSRSASQPGRMRGTRGCWADPCLAASCSWLSQRDGQWTLPARTRRLLGQYLSGGSRGGNGGGAQAADVGARLHDQAMSSLKDRASTFDRAQKEAEMRIKDWVSERGHRAGGREADRLAVVADPGGGNCCLVCRWLVVVVDASCQSIGVSALLLLERVGGGGVPAGGGPQQGHGGPAAARMGLHARGGAGAGDQGAGGRRRDLAVPAAQARHALPAHHRLATGQQQRQPGREGGRARQTLTHSHRQTASLRRARHRPL